MFFYIYDDLCIMSFAVICAMTNKDNCHINGGKNQAMRIIFFHEDDYCQMEVLPLANKDFCLRPGGNRLFHLSGGMQIYLCKGRA